ncbi:MAG: hypothetical protein SFX72_16785 [Isosphaeraceae bacterium]|nr:hypothetical protein [Isosphaeraceae bacterium]
MRSFIFALSFCCSTNAIAGTVEFFDESSFLALSGGTQIVHFDELNPGDNAIQGNEYSGLGLQIVQREGLPINVLFFGDSSFITRNGFPESVHSQPNAISSSGVNVGLGHNDAFSDNFDFIFSTPVFAASLFVGNIGPGETSVQFLRPDGSVLAEETFTTGHAGLIGGGFNNRVFYGAITTERIGRIRTIEGTFDLDGILYDDIRFSASSAVPEPSGLISAAIGAVAWVGYRRRRVKVR